MLNSSYILDTASCMVLYNYYIDYLQKQNVAKNVEVGYTYI